LVEVWHGGWLYWTYPETSNGEVDAIAKGQEIAVLPWDRPERFSRWGVSTPGLLPVLQGGTAYGSEYEAEAAESKPYPGRSATTPCLSYCDGCSDEELIRRYRSDGDRCAQDQLFSRYWRKVYRRAFQLLNNRDDAQEVTQEVFIKV